MSYCKYCQTLLTIEKNHDYNNENNLIINLDLNGFLELVYQKLNNEDDYNDNEYMYSLFFNESDLKNVKLDTSFYSEDVIRSKIDEIYDGIIKENKNIHPFHYVCKTCSKTYLLKPNTEIDVLKLYSSNMVRDDKPHIRKHDPTLFRTKDFICVNQNCITNTDKSDETLLLKEAVFYKLGNTHNVNYICCTCNTHWRT